jgi:hypothetical protein
MLSLSFKRAASNQLGNDMVVVVALIAEEEHLPAIVICKIGTTVQFHFFVFAFICPFVLLAYCIGYQYHFYGLTTHCVCLRFFFLQFEFRNCLCRAPLRR